MCKEKLIDNRTRQRERLPLPDYPESEWCDFRRDYESGMTFKKIAEKYCCDPRTVKKCIWYNKSSAELGSQRKPTKIAAFVDLIDTEYQEIVFGKSFASEEIGICLISGTIFETKSGTVCKTTYISDRFNSCSGWFFMKNSLYDVCSRDRSVVCSKGS